MRLAVAGANGRMGRMLIEAVLNSTDLTLTAALAREGAAYLGQDAAAFLGTTSGVTITDDLGVSKEADCLIDFTLPDALNKHLDACVKFNTQCVIGTTGFTAEQKQAIYAAGQKIALVFAPNMSVGVNVTLKLIDVAARLLNNGFDVEV